MILINKSYQVKFNLYVFHIFSLYLSKLQIECWTSNYYYYCKFCKYNKGVICDEGSAYVRLFKQIKITKLAENENSISHSSDIDSCEEEDFWDTDDDKNDSNDTESDTDSILDIEELS